MKKIDFFLLVRLIAVVWAGGMLTAIDSIGVLSQGQVELDTSAKQTYSNVLWAGLSSFLTESVVKN